MRPRAFPASFQGRLIWPLNVSPSFASARHIFPEKKALLVTVPDAMPRDRIPRCYTLLITTAQAARVARPRLVGGGSSECGLLLEPSSVLNGGLGGELWRKSLTAGSRLRHTWNHGLVRNARAECFLTQ